jgi:hypothetical protein
VALRSFHLFDRSLQARMQLLSVYLDVL